MAAKKRGPAIARKQLRSKLRQARNAEGKTQIEIAEALEWSPSKLLRIENGQTTVSKSDLIALITQYPNLANERDAMLALAAEAKKASYSDVYVEPFKSWLEYEAYADLVQQYEPTYVPGVLQTDDYASAVVPPFVDYNAVQSAAIVQARLERSRLLVDNGGPRMEFIIDETVIRRAVGNEKGTTGYSVMIDQLTHLKQMNTVGRKAQGETIESTLNPAISLQIAPLEMGAYIVMNGPFELLDFDDAEFSNMMYFEDLEGDQVIRDNYEQIEKYIERFDKLKKQLPSPGETNQQLDLIIQLMTENRNGIPLLSRRGE